MTKKSNFYGTGLGILSSAIVMGPTKEELDMKMKAETLMITAQEEGQKVDIRVIALDETDGCIISPCHAEHINMVVGVYMYDKNDPVPVCEARLSYSLIHIMDRVYLTSDGHDALSNDEIEEIYDTYENGTADDIYMYCSDVDSLEAFLTADKRYHVEGEVSLPENTTYEEYMEDMYEDIRCNIRL